MKLIIDIPDETYNKMRRGETLYPADANVAIFAIETGNPIEECGDCISRQSVLDLAKFDGRKNLGSIIHAFDVERLPPVKPTEKVGQWIACVCKWGDGVITVNGYRCDKCNAFNSDEDNYCPSCGAKMGGEQND